MNSKSSIILYIGAGILFFFFWLYIVFPYDALQSRVITEIENQTGGRYKIDMKDMEISLLFGNVTFEDLKVSEMIGGKKQLLLKTPVLEIGFSPLGLLSQKMDFDFYLEGNKKGEIEGDFRQEGATTELNMEFDEFPLSELKFLAAKAKVGLKGSVEGEVQLKMNPKNPSQNNGIVDLQLINLKMDPTSIALDPSDPASAMTIPAIKFTGPKGSHIKAKVLKDNLDIQSVKFMGGDLDLDLKGKVTLKGRTPQDYRLNIKGGFKMTEALTKALPFLFILEKQRDDKGVYPLTITGRMGKPNIQIGKFRVPL